MTLVTGRIKKGCSCDGKLLNDEVDEGKCPNRLSWRRRESIRMKLVIGVWRREEFKRLKVHKHENFLLTFFAETETLWCQGPVTRDF